MLPRMKLVSTFLLLAFMLSIVPAANAQPVQAATCYWAQFVSDVSVPDGTNYTPGATFTKTWRIKNIGTCAWTTSDVSLIFKSGEQMGAPASSALSTTVNPGQTVDLTLNLTAPSAAGHYFGFYKFKSTTGGEFGISSTVNNAFWVEINVNSASSTGYDFTAHAADSGVKWSSGAGVFTFPGTDGSANGFALKLDTPKFESGVTSAQAGLLFAPNNVTNGYVQATYPAFKVQSGDHFQATIGCQFSATTCYVAYRLDYQIGSGAVKTFWTFREKYEGLTYNVNKDLSSLAGQDVIFTLVVDAYGSPTGDRALWVNPIITRSGGGTTPPTPTSCTDRASFVSDLDVSDGKTYAPNQAFTKSWRLKNVGTCTWTTAYQIIYDSGDKMGGPDTAALPISVAPGQTVDISISLKSPITAGTYKGFWKFKNNNGTPFGLCPFGNCLLGNQKAFWIQINVVGAYPNP
jgi:hypothetical protein